MKKYTNKHSLTKIDLIRMIIDDFDSPQDNARTIVEETLSAISSALKDNNKLKISSFGTFVVNNRKERMAINPRTKMVNKIEAKKVLKFRPSRKLKLSLR